MFAANALPAWTVQREHDPRGLKARKADALAALLLAQGLSRDAMIDLLETAAVRKAYGREAVAAVRVLVGAR
ncbi:MAG TPA: hypothetical protein VMV41_12365 [Cellulomonadaceae bacterium]|nr:hypothetical protein [Cellulomonadaceae bacterium]